VHCTITKIIVDVVINQLNFTYHGTRLLPYHHAPTSHNEGERDYLFHQAGQLLSFQDLHKAYGGDDDDNSELNEGFVDHNADSPLSQEQDLLMVCEGNEVEEDNDDYQQVGLVTMLHTYAM